MTENQTRTCRAAEGSTGAGEAVMVDDRQPSAVQPAGRPVRQCTWCWTSLIIFRNMAADDLFLSDANVLVMYLIFIKFV